MEIKAQINKPYTEKERLDFIIKYNHNLGFEIEETEISLLAWGYTQEELDEQEKARINELSLTKREVFLALYKDKGIAPEQVRSKITDIEAQIEFDYANEYYRYNPLIDKIGLMLGYTSAELDYLFKNKEFQKI